MKNMRKINALLLGISVVGFTIACSEKPKETSEATEKKDSVVAVVKHEQVVVTTPDEALAELKTGNVRFVNGALVNTNYKERIEQTKEKQTPHSVILSCMDSRVPPEIIFDQGIGNIFVNRVAGNVEDDNIIGSMEYAVEHAKAKLIVILAHSHCGAVTGAVKDVKAGKLTQLLAQIKPAIKSDPNDPKTIDETAKNSTKISVEDILKKSEIIKEMVEKKEVAIVTAFYDIETGVVTFE